MKNFISIHPVLKLLLFISLYSTLCFSPVSGEDYSPGDEKEKSYANPFLDEDHLVILWTNADRDVALKMIHMYAFNAKRFGWWKEITIIIWGPTAKLMADDNELQDKFKELMESGIHVKACKGCADQYEEVSSKLEAAGIDVLYVGKEFTDYIKSDAHVLTL